jgi:hypothetical protein
MDCHAPPLNRHFTQIRDRQGLAVDQQRVHIKMIGDALRILKYKNSV